ncbi:MAG: F-box protein [Candidatus Thiodiazotropha taylori]|nr:F-box protein [Candidatus Thiodiazotropha taylori]MCW4261964.1 F-box protein [Candidatus Thiodiazotropha endolucinida]MCG8033223.1 F-box protein [Candidatus Thiodiazotropha taylori]MCG8048719.1 F-box protein [Candidatus Thiodiazotropha taylori]MCG8111313.1 F-box protein [Candidatus Thiodiazotropha taylori]
MSVVFNDAVPTAFINDRQGTFIQLSARAMTTLLTFWNAVKLPVRRKLNFDDAETRCSKKHCTHRKCTDDDEAREPLISLEMAASPGYVGDGWRRARKTKDIKWISELEIKSLLRTVNYLGIAVNTEARENNLPAATITQLPLELVEQILENLEICDVLKLSQCCKHLNSIIDTADTWRKMLYRDFKCYSFSVFGYTEGSRDLYRECYKTLFWSDLPDDIYKQMS